MRQFFSDVLADCSIEALATISHCGSPFLAQMLAAQRPVPTALFSLLAFNGTRAEWLLVADHPETPPAALYALAKYEADVREVLARRRGLPTDLQILFAQDAAPNVRLAFARNAEAQPSLIANLCDDVRPEVAAAARSNPRAPVESLFAAAAVGPDPALARNPAAPAALLGQLSRQLPFSRAEWTSVHRDVAIALAEHPALPSSIQTALVWRDDPEVTSALRRRGDLTPRLREQLGLAPTWA